MASWHYSPKTKAPARCRAGKKPCPYGGEHFESEEAAWAAHGPEQAKLSKAYPDLLALQATWFSRLTGEEQEAVGLYSQATGHRRLNEHLRAGTLSPQEEKLRDALDGALAKAEGPGEVACHRGLLLKPQEAAKLVPGARHENLGYTSTSLQERKALLFTLGGEAEEERVLLTFTTTEGAPLDLGEEELLHGRGLSLTITAREEARDKFGSYLRVTARREEGAGEAASASPWTVAYGKPGEVAVGAPVRSHPRGPESIIVEEEFSTEAYQRESEAFQATLTAQEKAALTSYVDEGSYGLNHKLWQGEELTAQEEEVCAALDSLCEKAASQGAPARELYRRLPMAKASLPEFQEAMAKYEPGAVVELPGYSSTTSNPMAIHHLLREAPLHQVVPYPGKSPQEAEAKSLEMAEAMDESWRCNTLLRVTTASGAPVSSPQWLAEEEYLLPRNSRLRVTKVTQATFETTVDGTGHRRLLNQRKVFPIVVIDGELLPPEEA